MLKQLKFAAIALLVAVGFTACSDDEPTPVPTPLRGEAGMYVINQGNTSGNVAGALDFIAQNGTKTDSVFFKANGQLIGDNPQKPIIYGSKMYVPVYKENLVWVLDANTATVIASVQTNQPEAVCASNGHVYISNYDGHVTRIDTTNYTKSDPLPVGPNPYGITAANGKVYVACSDASNYANNYANSAIAVIDEATFSKVKRITNEGITNPWEMATDNSGNVYVTTPYTANKVWKIDANDNVSALCDGTYIATNTQNRTSRATGKQDLLYVIHAVTDWDAHTTTVSSSVYNAATGAQVSNNFLQTPANTDEYKFAPICMDVNPANGDIYVCSDNGRYDNPYANPGYINVYTSNGAFSKRIATGIHPYGVIFK